VEGRREVAEGVLEIPLALADVALHVAQVLEDAEDDVAIVRSARVVRRPVGQLVHHLSEVRAGGAPVVRLDGAEGVEEIVVEIGAMNQHLRHCAHLRRDFAEAEDLRLLRDKLQLVGQVAI